MDIFEQIENVAKEKEKTLVDIEPSSTPDVIADKNDNKLFKFFIVFFVLGGIFLLICAIFDIKII